MNELNILKRVLSYRPGQLQVELLRARRKEIEKVTASSRNKISDNLLEECAAIDRFILLLGSASFSKERDLVKRKYEELADLEKENRLLKKAKKEESRKIRLENFKLKQKAKLSKFKKETKNKDEGNVLISKPKDDLKDSEVNPKRLNRHEIRTSLRSDVLIRESLGLKLDLKDGDYIAPWDDVNFRLNRIMFKYLEKDYDVHCLGSLQSLEIVKSIFVKRYASGLCVTVRNGKATTDLRNDIENLLKAPNSIANLDFGKYFIQVDASYTAKKHDIHSSLEVKDYRYGKYLVENRDLEKTITPIEELNQYDARNSEMRIPGLLFPFQKGHSSFIVFESLSQNRSTYLFRMPKNETKHEEAKRMIISYFSGTTPNKRSTLRNSRLLQYDLGFIKALNHDIFYVWKTQLEECMRR